MNANKEGWVEEGEIIYKTCKDDCFPEIRSHSSNPGFGPWAGKERIQEVEGKSLEIM